MSKPAILYDNRLGDGAPVASSTAAGEFAAANLADWRPFTWWKPAVMPATVTVDAGTAKAADYALVSGHDLGTRGATLEVRGSSDGFGAVDTLVASHAPADDKPFMLSFGSVAWRHWRLRLTGAAAPALAIASIGTLFEFPEYLEEGFDPLGREPKGQINRAVAGNPLGRVTDYELWSQRLEFRRLSKAWIKATFVPAWQSHLRDTAFVFAWDRVGDPTDLKLVVTEGGFETPDPSGARADLRFKLEAAI